MYKRLFLLMILTAAFAAANSAQDRYRFSGPASGENARPQLVSETRASFNSGVVNPFIVERQAFDAINKKRTDNGLRALAWSEDVAQIARLHSRHMAEQKFFGHRDTEQKIVSDRANDAGLAWRAIGENIAFDRGFEDPIEKAVELWLDSSGHRQNLMNPIWQETAVGVAIGTDGSYYFTQVFLLR